MFLLRYLYLLALSVWLGGLVAVALSASAVFAALEAWNPDEGRVLAGQTVGSLLHAVHPLLYGAGAVMLATLTARRLLGPRPVAYGIRASLVTLMLGFALASGFGISPRVEAMQREIGSPVASLPESDPRRQSFYRLHGLSNLLLGATVIAGLILMIWESRE
jgi:hypothetical protein